jgi:hypothetical protein
VLDVLCLGIACRSRQSSSAVHRDLFIISGCLRGGFASKRIKGGTLQDRSIMRPREFMNLGSEFIAKTELFKEDIGELYCFRCKEMRRLGPSSPSMSSHYPYEHSS